MKMLVLAGGFGTRLQSVVSNVPKALAPVADFPFMQYQLGCWVSQGVTSLVFLLHHQSEMIIDFLEDRPAKEILGDCKVECVFESSPLGTGGAVLHALRSLQIEGEFLLANADTWLGSAVLELLNTPAPSIGVVYVTNAERYGRVEIDVDNKVTKFLEKPPTHLPGWINTGIALLNSEVFQDMDESVFSIESKIYPALAERRLLNAAQLQCNFIDIGVPDDYYRFCRWIESRRLRSL